MSENSENFAVKINAIQSLRKLAGIGLKEAKDLIEKHNNDVVAALEDYKNSEVGKKELHYSEFYTEHILDLTKEIALKVVGNQNAILRPYDLAEFSKTMADKILSSVYFDERFLINK